MVVDNEFNIGDLVYLITDPEQNIRIVDRIYINPNGVTYGLTCGTEASTHYEIEISRNKNFKL